MLLLASLASAAALAQLPANLSSRLAGDWRTSSPISIGGLAPLGQQGTDLGPAAASQPLGRMLLLLAPSSAQQSALNALLAALADPTSPQYHQWLTPQQFAASYANSASDVAAVVSWLESQGFQVAHLPSGRGWIEFSGTVSQAEQAFGAPIHTVAGANGISRPVLMGVASVPAALRPVVAGLVSLDGVLSTAALTPPEVISSTASAPALTPAAVATLLHLKSLTSAGINGAGQSIAIASRSNLNPADLTAFQAAYGLPAASLAILPDGPDPGLASDQPLATLAVSWAGAAAPGANIVLVPAQTTSATDGLDLSLAAIVDRQLAGAVAVPYSACEAGMSAAHQVFYSALYQQASAQGISIVVASGDTGAAACAQPGAGLVTTGYGVNALASTPWNTVVGVAAPSADGASFTAWSQHASADAAFAGGGGRSALYRQPTWQPVPTSIADVVRGASTRMLPDLSLPTALDSASPGLAFCLSSTASTASGCTFVRSGGSGVAASLFASIAALRAQKWGAQGNLASSLYQLGSRPGIFNDVAQGSARLTCAPGSADCSSAGQIGYDAAAGYDLATGLGIPDASALVLAQPLGGGSTIPTVINQIVSGQTINPSGSVVLAAEVDGSGGIEPAGTITFYDASTSSVIITIALTPNAGTSKSTATQTVTGVLAQGSHSIQAEYTSSDNTYASANSSAVTVISQPTDTTATVTPASNNPAGGASLLVTAIVSSANAGAGAVAPSGSVTFKLDNVTEGSAHLVAGLASGAQTNSSTSISINVPYGAGSHSIVAVYAGDTNYNTTTSLPATINVGASTPTVSLGLSSTTPGVGSNVTLTATITPPGSGSGATAPTGTVSFLINGSLVATGNVITSSGVTTATANITAPAIGTYSVQAIYYSGDSNYNNANSNTVTLNVGKMGTTLVVTPASTTPAINTSFQVTATLSPAASSSNTATGTVTFTLDGVSVATANLGSGTTATALISITTSGTHQLAATYNGDTNFAASTASTVTLTVARTPTTTVDTPSSTTPGLGSTLTVNTTITPTAYASADPTGTVTYTLDGVQQGIIEPVVPGVPSTSGTGFSVTTAGTHSLIATYSGDTNYAASTSAAITLTVAKPTTTIAIVPATTSPFDASSLSVTATVTPSGSGTVNLSGTVALSLDGTTVATGVVSGAAPVVMILSFVVPSAGNHSLTATYTGDSNYATSSTTTPVVLNALKSTPTIAVVPASMTPAAGSTLQLTAQISPANTGATLPAGSVNFFIDNVSVGTASVISGAPATATLSITAPSIGLHLITATYSGDTNYNNTSSGSVTINVIKANTTLAVTPASSAPAPNSSMQVTATITASVTGSVVPTGNVNFTMDGISVGSASVSGGTTAIVTVTVPATGIHTLQASYIGDSNFNGSTSAIATYTVAKTATSTVVVPATTTPALGSTLQVTASVSTSTPLATSPSGSVTFTVDGIAAATQALIPGTPSTATVTLPSMTPGPHAIAANYGGDTYYSASTATAVTVTVPKAATSMTVTPSTITPAGGSTLAVGASIVPAIVASTLPTGTVNFTLDGTAVASSAVVSANPATATANINQITPGSHQLAATYTGDTYYAAATAQAVVITVSKSPSTTTLIPSTTSPTGGESLPVTVNVTSTSPSTALPSGSVTVAVDGVSVATGTLLSGSPSTATVTIPLITAGTHLLTATYGGDSYYTGSNSTTVNVIAAKGATTTTVAATPATLTAGTTESLTATIAPTNALTGATYTISGTVTFYDGTALLGVASVVKNSATLNGLAMAINVNHNITAVYGGDTNWQGSTSTILPLDATTAPDLVVLASNYSAASPAPPGAAVILTATVSPSVSSSTTLTAYPTGTVVFYSGTTPIGTATLVAQKNSLNYSSLATLSITNLPGGTDAISAIYQGDLSYDVATSNTITITVQNFTVTPSAANPITNLTIVRGSAGAITFDINGYGGYSSQIQVVCQVPTQDNMTCTPSPQVVSAPSAVTFAVQTFITSAAQSAPTPIWPRAAGGAALAGLLFFLLPFGRRSRTMLRANARRALVLLLMLVGLAGVGIGCTSTSALSTSTGATPLGVATLKVIAQANVNATTVSQTAYFTVNVVTQ